MGTALKLISNLLLPSWLIPSIYCGDLQSLLAKDMQSELSDVFTLTVINFIGVTTQTSSTVYLIINLHFSHFKVPHSGSP